jgi:hypothetical protein
MESVSFLTDGAGSTGSSTVQSGASTPSSPLRSLSVDHRIGGTPKAISNGSFRSRLRGPSRGRVSLESTLRIDGLNLNQSCAHGFEKSFTTQSARSGQGRIIPGRVLGNPIVQRAVAPTSAADKSLTACHRPRPASRTRIAGSCRRGSRSGAGGCFRDIPRIGHQLVNGHISQIRGLRLPMVNRPRPIPSTAVNRVNRVNLSF